MASLPFFFACLARNSGGSQSRSVLSSFIAISASFIAKSSSSSSSQPHSPYSSTSDSSPESSASLLAWSFWDLAIRMWWCSMLSESLTVTVWQPWDVDFAKLGLFLGGRPLGLGGIVFFFGGGEVHYLEFFSRNHIAITEIYPKMTFSIFLRFI